MLSVTIREKDGEERRLVFENREVTIGRAKGCEILLPRSNISKKHARLVDKDDKIVLVDLRSTNGTYVNGRRITAPEIVGPDDKIYIGDYVLRAEGVASADQPAAEAGDDAPQQTGAMHSLGGATSGEASSGPMDTRGGAEPSDEGAAAEDTGEAEASPPSEPEPEAAEAVESAEVEAADEAADDDAATPAEEDLAFELDADVSEETTLDGDAATSADVVTDEPLPSAAPAAAEAPPSSDEAADEADSPSREEPAPAEPSEEDEATAALDLSELEGLEETEESLGDRAQPPGDEAWSSEPSAAEEAAAATPRSEPVTDPEEDPSVETDSAEPVAETETTGPEHTATPGGGSSEVGAVPGSEPGDDAEAEAAEDAEADPGATGELASREEGGEPARAAPALGLDALDKLLANPAVEQILVNRYDRIAVMHEGETRTLTRGFASQEALDQVLERLLRQLGREPSKVGAVVEGTLPDGATVHAVQPPLAPEGPVITIRRPGRRASSPRQLAEEGVLPEHALNELRRVVRGRGGVLVAGPPRSGRSTLSNALAAYVPEDERLLLVEATRELALPHENVVHLDKRSLHEEGVDLVELMTQCAARRALVDPLSAGDVRRLVHLVLSGYDGWLATATGDSAEGVLRRMTFELELDAGVNLDGDARAMVAEAVGAVVLVRRRGDGLRVESVRIVDGLDADGFRTSELLSGDEP